MTVTPRSTSMEEWMKKKQLGVIGAIASAALIASAMLVPSANAATKTITIWADDQRGPQLTKLLQGNTTIVPGYTINIKFFSSLTALQSAWADATAATAPDIYAGAEDTAADVKSGKLAPIQMGTEGTNFSKGGISFVSYGGHTYGVPLDTDTTALVYNKAFSTSAPTSLASMISYYVANKTAKGFTAGLCFPDGVWDSQAFLDAMGGGAWDISGRKPNYTKVVLNSPAFIGNVNNLLYTNGVSNGFISGYDASCTADFEAGKIPFAMTGAWNFSAFTAKGINYGLTAMPGLKAGTTGAQWVGYSGAYLTSYAAAHGTAIGARQLLVNWFASTQGQLAMSKLSSRPPAAASAVALVTDPQTLAVGTAAAAGQPQIDTLLNDSTGGTNWYDTLTAMYKALFEQGKDVTTTINAAADIVQKNFTHAAAQL